MTTNALVPPTPSAAGNVAAHLVGHIDALKENYLSGWAVLLDDSSGAVTTGLALELVHEGETIASFMAVSLRPDVVAQLGGDGRCGFKIPMPGRFSDGTPRILQIRQTEGPGPQAYGSITLQANEADVWSKFVSCKADFEHDAYACYEGAEHRAAILRNRDMAGFIEDLGEVFPKYRVDRPLPQIINPVHDQFEHELAEVYGQVAQAHSVGTSSRLVRLTDVYVCNNRIHHIAGTDVLTIYETARPPDRPYTDQPDWTPASLVAAAATIDALQTPLYLGSPGFANYGHWLVDDLAHAKAVETLAGISGDKVRIVAPGAGGRLDAIKNETLQAFYGEHLVPGVFFIPPNTPVHFPVLHYVSPHSYHPVLKSPDACRHLRGRAEAMSSTGGRRDAGARLFVGRNRRHGRGLTNEDEVAACVARLGFRLFDPEQLSFTDQVAAFLESSIVVGQMGAAMTTTMFCAPGTTLLYLAPRGWVEPFYWDLAAVCEHRYHVQYGAASHLRPEVHLDDFTIDVGQLNAAIEAALAG